MRPTIKQTMLDIAEVLSHRATCSKLAVGAVLVDKFNRIIGSGYNGVPHDLPHCTDFNSECVGANAPAGSDLCMAVHAECNALLNCRDIHGIASLYVTHPPCLRCTKELLNTSCQTIYVRYTLPFDNNASRMWVKAGRVWSFE
jgi:dCMP deaminase